MNFLGPLTKMSSKEKPLAERLNDEEILRLVELSKMSHVCPYRECTEAEKYNQCFNHSHVLCPLYEAEYERRKHCIRKRGY